jgi:hypothetical protein
MKDYNLQIKYGRDEQKWYIHCIEKNNSLYLFPDLTVHKYNRFSTDFETVWYETKEKAQKTLDQYNNHNSFHISLEEFQI